MKLIFKKLFAKSFFKWKYYKSIIFNNGKCEKCNDITSICFASSTKNVYCIQCTYEEMNKTQCNVCNNINSNFKLKCIFCDSYVCHDCNSDNIKTKYCRFCNLKDKFTNLCINGFIQNMEKGNPLIYFLFVHANEYKIENIINEILILKDIYKVITHDYGHLVLDNNKTFESILDTVSDLKYFGILFRKLQLLFNNKKIATVEFGIILSSIIFKHLKYFSNFIKVEENKKLSYNNLIIYDYITNQ